MSTHTKDSPVKYRHDGALVQGEHVLATVPIRGPLRLPEIVGDLDGERLAICWNACLGIENPQEALRMAREALQNMLDLQDQMGIHETPKHYDEYLESARKALAALGDQPEEGAR